MQFHDIFGIFFFLGLPEGFFDEDQPPARPKEEESMFKEEQGKPKEPPKPNTSEVLPEGFFDDPVADAKVLLR